MTFTMFQRVVLTQHIPAEGLRAGDLGIIVEHSGQTMAVVSVPATAVREAKPDEILSARVVARA